jgi:hypothetical protein
LVQPLPSSCGTAYSCPDSALRPWAAVPGRAWPVAVPGVWEQGHSRETELARAGRGGEAWRVQREYPDNARDRE